MIIPARPVILVCCILLLFSGILSAEESTPGQDVEEQEKSAKSIEQVIEERDEILYDPTSKSLFPETHFQLRSLLYEWERKIGLEITVSYDTLFMGYADTGNELGGTAGDLTISGRWLLFGTKYTDPIYLFFRIRDRHTFTEYAPSDFSSETDLLWGAVNGFNDSGLQVPNFYLSQKFFKKRLHLYYGQFSIDHFFDSHALRSAKRFFLNQLFSDNPTVGFPSYGAGFVGHWQSARNWSATVGGSNIQGTQVDEVVDLDLDSKAMFEAGQGAYAFSGVGGRKARLQFMGWNSDANGERSLLSGDGLSITLEHEGCRPGEQFVFRYGHADDDSTGTDTLFFAAFGKEIKKYNHLGIGAGAGRSSETKDWQAIFEMYYRIRAAKELVVTPDLQVVLGDGVDGEDRIRFIAGVRLGLTF